MWGDSRQFAASHWMRHRLPSACVTTDPGAVGGASRLKLEPLYSVPTLHYIGTSWMGQLMGQLTLPSPRKTQ